MGANLEKPPKNRHFCVSKQIHKSLFTWGVNGKLKYPARHEIPFELSTNPIFPTEKLKFKDASAGFSG
tara:strand:+ start:835 stop:1038 length:204 start_codon:yes stop_codon:yes gene_type:complete